MPSANAVKGVVKVTADGRGFVVEAADGQRYVITAAHCLPHLPPAHGLSFTEDRTYAALLAPLGEAAPAIWTECMFADPVGDIAILREPDGQALPDQWDAYDNFTLRAVPLEMRRPQDEERAWILSLDGSQWFSCTVGISGLGRVWIADAAEPIRGGMSGSPVLGDDGRVICVCCLSHGGVDDEQHREGGPNPTLSNLPGWFLDQLSETSTGFE